MSIDKDPFPLPTRARKLVEAAPFPPAETGEFHTPFLHANAQVLRSQGGAFFVRPLVVDANVLRNDLLRAQREGRATALLDAGASGSVPLYCAPNVPAEVDEHLPEWQPNGALLEEARQIWTTHYLTVLRVVELPEKSLLTADEGRRIQELAMVDTDDIATATLAILLNAPVLTEDRPVLRAVYGDVADLEARAQWLRSALAGRALGEADFVVGGGLTLANALANVTVMGVRGTVSALRRMPPAGVIAVVLAFGVAAARSREPISERLRILGQAIARLTNDIQPLLEDWRVDRAAAAAHLLSMAPSPAPTTGDQEWHRMPRGVLERASIEIMARLMTATAHQLAPRLGTLPVPQGEAKVRAVLRAEACFHPLPRGRWQLGRPHWASLR